MKSVWQRWRFHIPRIAYWPYLFLEKRATERVLRRRLWLYIEATGSSLPIASRGRSDELVLDGVARGSGARRDGKFVVDRAEMGVDGARADH